MLNAQDAMRIKLKVLKAVGMSEESINMYCPELPPRNEKEVVPYSWVHDLLMIAKIWRNPVYMDLPEQYQHMIDSEVFDFFCTISFMCPYCVANTGKNYCDCAACSYGKIHGQCNNQDSQWVASVKRLKEQRNKNHLQ